MNLEPWSRLVSGGIAPVVALSACGFLTLALYNRLTTVITRARTFLRERLSQQGHLAALTRAEPVDATAVQRQKQLLHQLELQTNRVIARAYQIRRSLFSLHTAICAFIGCAGLKALEAFAPIAAIPSALLFLGGLALVFTAVLFAVAELRGGIEPVELESQFIRDWIGRIEPE